MLITLLILFPILIYLIELWQLKKHRMNAGVLLLIICCFEFTHFTMSTLQFQAVALEIAGINCAC